MDTTTTKTHQPSSFLFWLPPEVRSIIYELALIENEKIVPIWLQHPKFDLRTRQPIFTPVFGPLPKEIDYGCFKMLDAGMVVDGAKFDDIQETDANGRAMATAMPSLGSPQEHYFSRLTFELRNQIWELAFVEPEPVRLIEEDLRPIRKRKDRV
ncbi:hypothetical protein MMC13_004353 [Lambiella insularis]|nr:hypothetical protein [Lambiella insularis]